MKKLFNRKAEADEQGHEDPLPQQGVAQVPATVLTVEYVDDGESMDAAIRDLGERVLKMGEQVSAIQETQGRLVSAVNQQAKDIGKIVESLGRRIDRLYKHVTSNDSGSQASGWSESAVSDMEEDGLGPALTATTMALSADVADDPDHQNAWRTARVLAADLEAYHEDAVKEGVLYGTFYSVLREPIEKARKTYEQRVSRDIVDGYDYFSKALDELIARKRVELEEEGAL